MSLEEVEVQEGRLFNMVYYLLHRGHASAPELAEKFEVSVRTIYRDIDKLSSAGIPIYAEAGRNGGIFLKQDYVLDRTVFSDSEKEELLMALQSLTATKRLDNTGVLSKLSSLFNLKSSDWVEVDFSRWHEGQIDNTQFEALKSAVIRQHYLMITYVGMNGTCGKRKIAPVKLIYKSKAWYLKAYCQNKKAYRLFKLTRILNISLSGETFSNLPEEILAKNAEQSYRTIKLQFPKTMAYRVYDEFNQDDVSLMENGDLFVSTQMPEDTWLVGFLLSFGTEVEIIEPTSLQKIVAEQALKIFEKNKS